MRKTNPEDPANATRSQRGTVRDAMGRGTLSPHLARAGHTQPREPLSTASGLPGRVRGSKREDGVLAPPSGRTPCHVGFRPGLRLRQRFFFEAHARGLRPDRGSGCGPRSADEGDVRILGREERADGGNPVIHQACTHSVSRFSLRHAPHGRRPRRAGWVARPERGRARRASLQETLAAMVQCRLPGLNVPLTSPPLEPFK